MHKITLQLSVERVGEMKLPRFKVAQILASKATELLVWQNNLTPGYVVRAVKIRRTLSPR
jgi:hypothetical protein